MWTTLCKTGGQLADPVDNYPVVVAQPVDILHRCKYQM